MSVEVGGEMKKIARVFPTKTSYSPTDDMCFFDVPGLFDFNRGIEEVHISTVFRWDLEKAERLADAWKIIAPVKIGGPATRERADGFIPGMYLKNGITFTSRGCPNKCWFCSVWKRDGNIRELETIHPGNIIQDDNFLATSIKHQQKVFKMLETQKQIQFAGGLDPKFFGKWQCEKLSKLSINQLFFAYDTPDDFEPLLYASKLLIKHGFNRHKLRCYALIGYPKDTLDAAETRMFEMVSMGFYPMAMLYRDESGIFTQSNLKEWKKLQKHWARPAAISRMIKEINN